MQNRIAKMMLAFAAAGAISSCVKEQPGGQASANISATAATGSYYSPHAGHKGQPAIGFYMGAPPVTGRGAYSEPAPEPKPKPAPVASEPTSSAAPSSITTEMPVSPVSPPSAATPSTSVPAAAGSAPAPAPSAN